MQFTAGEVDSIGYTEFAGGKLNYAQITADAFGNAIGNSIVQADARSQSGLTQQQQQQQQEFSDISAGAAAALGQENDSIAAANDNYLAQTAAGDIYTAVDSPLTSNLELNSNVPLQTISVASIETPSLTAIGQEVDTGFQAGSLSGGADQWSSFFDPTAGEEYLGWS